MNEDQTATQLLLASITKSEMEAAKREIARLRAITLGIAIASGVKDIDRLRKLIGDDE